jgi:O-acetyl-ADP-ribose deacetylase (regulator of RNase III)
MSKERPPSRKNRLPVSESGVPPLLRLGRTEFCLLTGRQVGNIIHSGAEVLVSPADTNYVMRGRVANAIRQAGGHTIADELRKYKPLTPGDVAITGAGELPAKLVYHAVVASWKDKYRLLQTTLWHAVNRCLTLAQMSGIRSIAFPSLGTGSAKADHFESHSTMAAACLDALQPDSSLQRILFCFTNPDTAEIFRAAFLQQQLIRLARGLAVSDQSERDQLAANLRKVWADLLGLNANVDKLARLVARLEETPSATVIKQYIKVGDISDSTNIAIGHGAQAIGKGNSL